jgi:hypothetical protein
MPTVLREAGYRFFFYSNEGREPPHVHVQKAEAYAKVWLDTLVVSDVNGFNSSRVSQIIEIVRANQTFLLETWHEFFRH